MSTFLSAGGTYGFNLDFIKSPSSSSGCFSTVSKSSSLSIPTKRSRTSRKRPNQSYIEAATLLSNACPNVFSIKNLDKIYPGSLSSLSSSSLSSDVLPPFPIFNEADFLIEDPSSDPNPSFNFKFKPVNPVEESCIAFRQASAPSSPEYNVDSIFDDEAEEGIDSIMGKLSMNDYDSNCNSNIIPYINPFVESPIRLGLEGGFRVGFGGGLRGSILQPLGGTCNEDWRRQMAMVQMQDIFPKFNPLPSLEKKKTKKKKVEEVKDESEVTNTSSATSITAGPCKLVGEVKSRLGLKLSHEEVIKAWGDRRSPFSSDSDSGSPLSSAETAARLAEIDLFPDNERGRMRETSIQRYVEKRKIQHFSNKIRYQVRKVNADCKRRVKGRFVKKTRFLRGAMGEES